MESNTRGKLQMYPRILETRGSWYKRFSNLEEGYVIVVGNSHVVLRMRNYGLDLDLLTRVGERVATRHAQLNGPILQVDHAITVKQGGS